MGGNDRDSAAPRIQFGFVRAELNLLSFVIAYNYPFPLLSPY